MSRYHRMDYQKPYNIKYSQNFIKSDRLALEIINLARLDPNDLVIEIGPGEGSLTEYIVASGAKVLAVEKDRELAQNLRKIYPDENVEIVIGDFLEFELPNRSYKVIGNIPFALTSKIIRKILEYPNPPETTFLILQREAALRLMSNELLSLRYRPWFKFEIIKNFKPEDFYPKPSVTPVFLKITRHEFPLIKFDERDNYISFLTFCFLNSKFGLRSSLRKIFSFKQLGIISQKYNLKSKPSEISFEKWISLFQDFQKLVGEDKKRLIRDSVLNFERERNSNDRIYRSRAAFDKH